METISIFGFKKSHEHLWHKQISVINFLIINIIFDINKN